MAKTRSETTYFDVQCQPEHFPTWFLNPNRGDSGRICGNFQN
jgi:hypothetical protein